MSRINFIIMRKNSTLETLALNKIVEMVDVRDGGEDVVVARYGTNRTPLKKIANQKQ